MGKIVKVILFLILISCCISCASTKKVKKVTSDLCGYIVDENNRPIKDYAVQVRSNVVKQSEVLVTNENGIFYLPSFHAGTFYVNGWKEGYSKISNQKYELRKDKKVFCWQIKSVEAVLVDVENLIKVNQFEKALSLLNQLEISRKNEDYLLHKELKERLRSKAKYKKEDLNEEC